MCIATKKSEIKIALNKSHLSILGALLYFIHKNLSIMKKLILTFSLLTIFLLFSFTKKNTYAPPHKVASSQSCASCGTATNLSAVKNGTQITLDWNLSPTNVSNCSYGGYYNCTDCGPTGYVNFGGTTSSWPISISCTTGTYSIHFSITANCSDGSHT